MKKSLLQKKFQPKEEKPKWFYNPLKNIQRSRLEVDERAFKDALLCHPRYSTEELANMLIKEKEEAICKTAPLNFIIHSNLQEHGYIRNYNPDRDIFKDLQYAIQNTTRGQVELHGLIIESDHITLKVKVYNQYVELKMGRNEITRIVIGRANIVMEIKHKAKKYFNP